MAVVKKLAMSAIMSDVIKCHGFCTGTHHSVSLHLFYAALENIGQPHCGEPPLHPEECNILRNI